MKIYGEGRTPSAELARARRLATIRIGTRLIGFLAIVAGIAAGKVNGMPASSGRQSALSAALQN